MEFLLAKSNDSHTKYVPYRQRIRERLVLPIFGGRFELYDAADLLKDQLDRLKEEICRRVHRICSGFESVAGRSGSLSSLGRKDKRSVSMRNARLHRSLQ